MEIYPVNSVEFRTAAYVNGSMEPGRAEQFRLRLEKAVNGNSASSENISKMVSERNTSAGSDIYFSTIRPQFSRQAPVTGKENSSKLYYNIKKNPAGNYQYSPVAESDNTNQYKTEERFSAGASREDEDGFVYTLTDEHLEMLKEYSGNKARNPIYMRYNSGSEQYKGSLVNLVF